MDSWLHTLSACALLIDAARAFDIFYEMEPLLDDFWQADRTLRATSRLFLHNVEAA